MPLANLSKLDNQERQQTEADITALRSMFGQQDDLDVLFNQIAEPPAFKPPVLKPLPTLDSFLSEVPKPQIQPLPEVPTYQPMEPLQPTETQKLAAIVGSLAAPEFAWAFLSAPYVAQRQLTLEEEERRLRQFQIDLQRHSLEMQRIGEMNQQEMAVYNSLVNQAYQKFNALFESARLENAQAMEIAQAEWQAELNRHNQFLQLQLEKLRLSEGRKQQFMSLIANSTLFREMISRLTPETADVFGKYFGVFIPPELIQSLGEAGDVVALRLQNKLAEVQLQKGALDLKLGEAQLQKLLQDIQQSTELFDLNKKYLLSQIAVNNANATKLNAEAKALLMRSVSSGSASGADIIKMKLKEIDTDIDKLSKIATGIIEGPDGIPKMLTGGKPPAEVQNFLFAVMEAKRIQKQMLEAQLAGGKPERYVALYMNSLSKVRASRAELSKAMGEAAGSKSSANENLLFWGRVAMGQASVYGADVLQSLDILTKTSPQPAAPSVQPTPRTGVQLQKQQQDWRGMVRIESIEPVTTSVPPKAGAGAKASGGIPAFRLSEEDLASQGKPIPPKGMPKVTGKQQKASSIKGSDITAYSASNLYGAYNPNVQGYGMDVTGITPAQLLGTQKKGAQGKQKPAPFASKLSAEDLVNLSKMESLLYGAYNPNVQGYGMNITGIAPIPAGGISRKKGSKTKTSPQTLRLSASDLAALSQSLSMYDILGLSRNTTVNPQYRWAYGLDVTGLAPLPQAEVYPESLTAFQLSRGGLPPVLSNLGLPMIDFPLAVAQMFGENNRRPNVPIGRKNIKVEGSRR